MSIDQLDRALCHVIMPIEIITSKFTANFIEMTSIEKRRHAKTINEHEYYGIPYLIDDNLKKGYLKINSYRDMSPSISLTLHLGLFSNLKVEYLISKKSDPASFIVYKMKNGFFDNQTISFLVDVEHKLNISIDSVFRGKFKDEYMIEMINKYWRYK